MYFFTHLFISRTLYQHFNEEAVLDKNAFCYGNIRPDINKAAKGTTHTLENKLLFVAEQSKILMKESLSPKDFSLKLGEICHYICDFFCYYHVSEKLYHRLIRHFFYELHLHFTIYKVYFRKKLTLTSLKHIPDQNLTAVILEFRREYLLQPQSYEKDIQYALLVTVAVCDTIFYYLHYPNLSEEKERTTAGGLNYCPEKGAVL
jgi:hypothetical protein